MAISLTCSTDVERHKSARSISHESFTLILTHAMYATNLFIIWKEQYSTTENANRSDIPLHVHDLNKQNNILHRHKQLRTFQQLIKDS